ncbi:MAG: DUF2812 domain-containing protein [Butyrivibrio sp.]|nr:DUF2812 domain-containing protein [Butyrivibrio sp.]
MDKDKKKNKLYREWFYGSQYDVEAMREHFEQMAAKGLMLKEIRGMTHCYERCEPKKLRFCVDCFDKATAFDSKAEPETLEYIEYCEKAGWHYVCTNGRLQYFCSEDTEAVPIQTDSGAEFKSLVRNTLRTNAIMWFVLPLLYLFTIAMQFFRDNYYSFLSEAANGMWHSVFFMYIVYIATALVGITRFLIFYFKNKSKASEGRNLWYYSAKSTKRYGIFVAVTAAATLAIMAAGLVYSAASVRMVCISIGTLAVMLLFGFISVKAVSSRKSTRTKNIVLTVVLSVACVYLFLVVAVLVTTLSGRYEGEVTKNGEIYRYSRDELPITMEELGVSADRGEYLYEETDSDVIRSVFASLYEYSDFYMKEDGEELSGYSVDVFVTKSKWLKNKYEEELVKFGEGVLTRLEGTAADGYTVYAVGANPYWRYLCGEDCQIFIRCGWELSGDQLELLIEAYGQ